MPSEWSWLIAVTLPSSAATLDPAQTAPVTEAPASVESPRQAALSAPHSEPKPKPESRQRLVWHYPRFRAWQYVASAATSGLNFTIETVGSPYPDSSVRGTVALDLAARSALRVSSAKGRERVAEISDYMWHGAQYFGVLEAIVVPLAFDRGNFDVAWQATMINWQVLGLAFLGTRLTHLSVGRARPSEYGCSSEPGASRPCRHAGPSFLSGHTSMSAAGAALSCWHHYALELYGGGLPDTVVCATLVTTTLAIGTMRVAADKHWATDVLSGLVLGSGIGIGVPYFLHYGKKRAEPLGAGVLPRNVALLPTFDSDGFGLRLAGWL